MKIRFRAFVPFALIALAAYGGDDRNRFRAELVGTQETPAIFTAGSGTLILNIADHDSRIDFQLTWENLSGPPGAAHVHFGQRNAAGGVSFFFCGGSTKPACPATTSGAISGSVGAADVIGPAAQGIAPGNLAAIIEMMRAGFTYGNMHTVAHPAGEIRGQLKGRGDGDRDD